MAISRMKAVFLFHLTQMDSLIIGLTDLVWMLMSNGLVLQVYDLKGERIQFLVILWPIYCQMMELEETYKLYNEVSFLSYRAVTFK